MSPPQLDALRAALADRGAAAFLTLDPEQQIWLTGFRAEDAHARHHARVDEVLSYNERPGAGTPSSHAPLLETVLEGLPAGAPVAIDE